MKILRILEVVKYGWMHAKQVSCREDCNMTKLQVFNDIIKCYHKYYLWSNNYVRESFWKLSHEQREIVGEKYLDLNMHMDRWYKEFYENNAFFAKYSSSKYETSLWLRKKRLSAYTKRYNFGIRCQVSYNVKISTQHFCFGQLKVGEDVVFGHDTDIDYTGCLTIGNGVSIAEGTIIFTHGHSFVGNKYDSKLLKGSNRAYPTPLTIGDNVMIGARCVIMPEVKSIGENSIISVGSVVTRSIPPNSIVSGNPAKILFEMPEGYRVYFAHHK